MDAIVVVVVFVVGGGVAIVDPRNLTLKFAQNRVNNKSDVLLLLLMF